MNTKCPICGREYGASDRLTQPDMCKECFKAGRVIAKPPPASSSPRPSAYWKAAIFVPLAIVLAAVLVGLFIAIMGFVVYGVLLVIISLPLALLTFIILSFISFIKKEPRAPLSLLTIAVPALLFVVLWVNASVQRSVKESNRLKKERASGIALGHFYADGPYVDFKEVLKSPKQFEGRVLRSRVEMAPFSKPAGFAPKSVRKKQQTMEGGRVPEALKCGPNCRTVIVSDKVMPNSVTMDVRFWCFGELDARNKLSDLLLIDAREAGQMEAIRQRPFEGDWHIDFTPDENTLQLEERYPLVLGARHLFSPIAELRREGEHIIAGPIAGGGNKGAIAGKMIAPDTLHGTITMRGFAAAGQENLMLKLSPHGDLAYGEAVFYRTMEEPARYKVRMKLRNLPRP